MEAVPSAVIVLGGPPGRLVPDLLAASCCHPPLMLLLDCRHGLCKPPPSSRWCAAEADVGWSPLQMACHDQQYVGSKARGPCHRPS